MVLCGLVLHRRRPSPLRVSAKNARWHVFLRWRASTPIRLTGIGKNWLRSARYCTIAATVRRSLPVYPYEQTSAASVKDIVAKLNEATHAAMDTPAIKTRFNAIGVIGIAPERRGPEYLAKYVVEEIARWEGPIKAAGLQVD